MVSALYFYMDELMPNVQQYQLENEGQDDEFNLTRTIPLDFEDMEPNEKLYMNKFLCDNTRMLYYERDLFDAIGTVAYSLEYKYDFRCQVMQWTNDKIRVNYFAGIKEERVLGKVIDSREDIEIGRDAEQNNPDLETVEVLRFNKATNFKGEIQVQYNERLYDMTTFIIIYHTSISNDTEIYSGWTFSNSAEWDDFWFAEENTILYYSQNFIIGQ